jgi:Xaa-Pro aminopeptidase
MFEAAVYKSRRKVLASKMNSGIILLPGNTEVGMNYHDNIYKFRQDSTFLYYFGLNLADFVAVIDVDSNESMLFADDLSMDDVVWTGPQPSVKELGASVGVSKTAPLSSLYKVIRDAESHGRSIHFVPAYRGDAKILINDLLGVAPSEQKSYASLELVHAIVSMRSSKEPREIEEIEKACAIGSEMHRTAMKMCKPGVKEQTIAGMLDGIALQGGGQVSFPTILSQHGETMHNPYHKGILTAGRLMLTDAGAETEMNYCSDFTRTIPVSGKYDSRQRDIYQAVLDCHNLVPTIAKPGVTWLSVHLAVSKLMTERLQDLGLMKGNVEDSVASGAHALFFPHGLGHMMGIDVHDMENLGQVHVGYDEVTRPIDQFGTNALRMGRNLEEGFVITDEPGCYFIPELVAQWKANETNAEYLNFDKIETFLDFGGVRIEDDVLITSDGCRFLGADRAPVEIDDIEAFMAK